LTLLLLLLLMVLLLRARAYHDSGAGQHIKGALREASHFFTPRRVTAFCL
jgi:hypothetical protein